MREIKTILQKQNVYGEWMEIPNLRNLSAQSTAILFIHDTKHHSANQGSIHNSLILAFAEHSTIFNFSEEHPHDLFHRRWALLMHPLLSTISMSFRSYLLELAGVTRQDSVTALSAQSIATCAAFDLYHQHKTNNRAELTPTPMSMYDISFMSHEYTPMLLCKILLLWVKRNTSASVCM